MSEPEADQSRDGARPVRWAYPIALGLPLIVLNAGWIANSEMKTGVTEMTISSLFIGVTFMLFVVTLINAAIRRRFPRAAFNQPELMVLYAMLSMSSAVAGIGNLGFFLPFLGTVFGESKQFRGWQSFWNDLPPYIGPRDPKILEPFLHGHSNPFHVAILAAWAFPLASWTFFLMALLWTTLCLSIILRCRWAEEEHLPFPVIVLPLEMTREGAPLYRSPLLWGGFALPCFFHSLNSLNSIYPTLPSFPINGAHDIVPSLTFPWTGLEGMAFGIHGSAIGFGYLIHTDMLFSLWFFYLLRKALNVAGVMMNWRDVGQGLEESGKPQFPYTSYQGWGAWLALGLSTLWLGGAYFKDYWRRAARGQEDPQEPLSARWALIGLVLGFLAVCGFVWVTGGSWWVPVAFFGIYLLIMLSLTRLQAETVILSPYLLWIAPQSMLSGLIGTTNLGRADIVHINILSWFNNDYRAAPMPQEMCGLQGVMGAGGRPRPLVSVLMLAIFVGIVAAMLWDLQLYYANGAETGNVNQFRINLGRAPWWGLEGALNHPKPPSGMAFLGTIVGFAATLLLAFVRGRFAGFPLTQAGYVVSVSWANDVFWFDMFLAWVIKVCILRYGGMAFYRKALPFFLGLILGDFVTGAFWSIIGMALRLDLYRTFA